jgi:two-component system cell cycle response regulator
VARAPLVLIVSQHEWASRSLDSVISPRGYAVLRAYNGQQALERSERNDPDAVFVDITLPDMTGAELTRELLDRDAVSRAAPILLIASAHVTREQKLQALEAGAWEIISLPLDAEELLLRIERYIRGKLESDRLKEDALIDALTGLYSWHGISRRISEVAAAAERYGRPLSCIVVAVGDEDGSDPDTIPAELPEVAEKLRAAVRTSDILARIGPREFAVVAPDTPPDGAQILATRLQEMSLEPGTSRPFRAGVYSVDDLQRANLDPMEFLLRATRATQQTRNN